METIIRMTVLYWFILLIIRITPRRKGSITTPYEYILVFLLGGMAIGVIVVDDHSIMNALIGISTIALNHIGISMLKQRSQRFGRMVDGTPVVMFENGKWQKDRMEHLLIQPQDVLTSARSQDVSSTADIKLAILERNGGFSIITKDEEDKNEAPGETAQRTESSDGNIPQRARR